MLNQQTLQTMNAMKLFGMAKSFEERLASPRHDELSNAEFVGMLVEDEKTHRENQRLKRLLKAAKLRFPSACMEDVDYRHPRGLTKQMLRDLTTTQWIEANRNVILTGPTGIGKSWLACAMGNLAARAGHSVNYWRAPRLFAALKQAKGDGSHLRMLTRLGKVRVLILDDLLLTPLAAEERKDLLEIVEDRYQIGSTIIGTQCPIKGWHAAIGDPTLADAVCDRLIHNAYKLQLRGPSIRPKRGRAS
jgi:DNA replication protein DnaC